MSITQSFEVMKVKTDGWPTDDAVKAGRVFLFYSQRLVPARPVQSYPVEKGEPPAWQTNEGDYVKNVHNYLLFDMGIGDLETLMTGKRSV
jgi:hypothetical protein